MGKPEARMISTACHSARDQRSRGPSGVFAQSKLRTRATISGARPLNEAAACSRSNKVSGSPIPDSRRMSLMAAPQISKLKAFTMWQICDSDSALLALRLAGEEIRAPLATRYRHHKAGIHHRDGLHVFLNHLLRLEPFNLMDDIFHIDAFQGVDMGEARGDLLRLESGVFGED